MNFFISRRFSQEAVLKVSSIELLPEFVRAPTTKAVGSKEVTKLEPTALVVGLQKIEVTQTFETVSCENLREK